MATMVLEWDVADRMRKALRVSKVGVQEMAEYLGVERGTVSTWINGRIKPSTQTIRLFALRTGVPYEWLSTGQVTDNNDPSGGGIKVTRGFRTYPFAQGTSLIASKSNAGPNTSYNTAARWGSRAA